MQNVLIASFSQKGTTSAVSERIAAGLRKAGCEVSSLRIGRDKTPDLSRFDTVGVGTPAYVFRPPYVVTDFLRSLPDLTHKSFFAFVLHGTVQGACGNRVRSFLARKNAIEIGYFDCYGADYFIGYLKRGYLFSPDAPAPEDLEAAERFGADLPRRARDGANVPEPLDPATPFWFGVERMLTARLFTRLVYGTAIHADKRCDNCGVCIAACPTHNIVQREGRTPRWGRNCLLCATCELRCPRDAVHTPYDWRAFAPLLTYNVRRGVREKIPFAMVTHAGGVTRRQ